MTEETMSDEDRRQHGNRRVPENIMGRRESDKFDIGEWLRKHYIDPVLKDELQKQEEKFEEKVVLTVEAAVQKLTAVIQKEDGKRDWRSFRIGALTAALVSFLTLAIAKLKGWL